MKMLSIENKNNKIEVIKQNEVCIINVNNYTIITENVNEGLNFVSQIVKLNDEGVLDMKLKEYFLEAKEYLEEILGREATEEEINDLMLHVMNGVE